MEELDDATERAWWTVARGGQPGHGLGLGALVASGRITVRRQ